MRYLSPLRYPGGKAKLAAFFERTIKVQARPLTCYAEPFAGGVGAGLRLLHNGAIDELKINDLNPGIAAFWRAITTQPKQFCQLINACELSIDEWHRQKQIADQFSSDDLSLGFATFYLNRTNHSGIIRGRPIGGLDQSGKWKIDARFNRTSLQHRVRRVAELADRITVSELDAITFLKELPAPESTLVYVDPPYVEQGDYLYFSRFGSEQHEALAKLLRNAEFPWILTYGYQNSVIKDHYSTMRSARYSLNHSANLHQVGKEYMTFSDELIIPDLNLTPKAKATWEQYGGLISSAHQGLA